MEEKSNMLSPHKQWKGAVKQKVDRRWQGKEEGLKIGRYVLTSFSQHLHKMSTTSEAL